MTRFHLQSLLFVLVLMASILITRPYYEGPTQVSSAERVEETSLVAQPAVITNSLVASEEYEYAFPSLTTIEREIPRIKDNKEFFGISPSRSSGLRTLLVDASPELSRLQNGSLSIDANVFLVKELEDDHTLFIKNDVQRWPIASLVKLMTAAVALEHIGEDKRITISQEVVQTEGLAGDFVPGEVFTVQDIVAAMLVASSNDAAAALGEFYGTKQFIDRMQLTASRLNMSETSFSDVSGLSYLNQSVVGDLEKLVRYILEKHPTLFDMTTKDTIRITDLRTGKQKIIRNNNEFTVHPDFIGGKTGYTDEARGNLLSLFRDQGNTFLIIVLGSEDRFGETRAMYDFITNR